MLGKGFGLFTLALVAAQSFGCAHKPPPAPCTETEPVRVALKARQTLNPDESGQSFPTIVRVYLLKNPSTLEVAGADEVLRHDRDVLASDLLDVQEITVRPGATETLTFKRPDLASAVAVVGLFRAPVGNTWRLLTPLPAANADHCHEPAEAARPHVTAVLEESRISTGP
ncbi:MAG: type VI secretion system lipoprotein TssJ [Myxococcales bacterium]|nr:type VI secretion system lipoprotein TssJ [Myxococcales bacterium]